MEKEHTEVVYDVIPTKKMPTVFHTLPFSHTYNTR